MNDPMKSSASDLKAERMMSLAETIVKRHQEIGPGSPVKSSLIAELSFRNNDIREKHKEGLRYLKIAFEAFYERDRLIGIASGEPSEIKTLEHYIDRVMEALMKVYDEDDDAWEEWGFKSFAKVIKDH